MDGDNNYVWGLKKEIESDNTTSMTQGSLDDLKKAYTISPEQETLIDDLEVNQSIDIETIAFDPQHNTLQASNFIQVLRLS